MIRSTPRLAAACLAAVLLALGACGDDDERRRRGDAQSDGESLPTPGASAGVTGTADVAAGGDGYAPSLGGAPQPVAPADGDLVVQDVPQPELNPETGLGIDPDGDGPLTAPPAADTGAAEPTAADAVGVVRDYYAAVNARNYARAYALWSGDGRASGQTPEQFAGGFADTQGVSVEVGAPGAEDAGAGQRYVQVPVSVSATQGDGSVRRYAGSFTLHRTVVDGATPEQRGWQIRNADLREVAE